MKALTFKGGIHPKDSKGLTKDKSIKPMKLPASVTIPLRQHLGAPCEIKVAVGDMVKTGQVIGDSPAFVCASIHASISGKITKIGQAGHPVLGRCQSITIESDDEDKWITLESHQDWDRLPLEKMRAIIKKAGIVGLGGAGFPTHVKLSPSEGKTINSVILNGAECEPYLTADHRLMVERAKDVVLGLKIIMKVVGAKKGYVGIETNKPNAISLMEKASSSDNDITVIALEVKYPQGAEKQLIKAILNREVPAGGLPMDVGCLVQNVGTALAIKEAVLDGKPLIERVITVTGEPIETPQNLRVRIGTSFADVIESCGGFTEEPGKIIMGGPMMGLAQWSLDIPVIKTTSSILALTKNEAHLDRVGACIRCGQCINACSMGLMPNMLALLSERGRYTQTRELGILSCVECGSCAFVCPAKRPLIHYLKLAKYYLSKQI